MLVCIGYLDSILLNILLVFSNMQCINALCEENDCLLLLDLNGFSLIQPLFHGKFLLEQVDDVFEFRLAEQS